MPEATQGNSVLMNCGAYIISDIQVLTFQCSKICYSLSSKLHCHHLHLYLLSEISGFVGKVTCVVTECFKHKLKTLQYKPD